MHLQVVGFPASHVSFPRCNVDNQREKLGTLGRVSDIYIYTNIYITSISVILVVGSGQNMGANFPFDSISFKTKQQSGNFTSPTLKPFSTENLFK